MIHPFLLHCFQKQLLLHCFLKTAFLCRFQKSIPLLSRFPYHGFTSQCNFLYPSITFGNMLQQQSATFLRHFLNRLFHYRQLRMNQGSQGCARHAAKRHILRNAQATLLDSTLGSQHSSLRKAKDRIKGYILLQETLHHPTTLFSRQGWRQDILRLILYMKLFQRIPIAPQSFIAVSDAGPGI